MHTVLPQMPPDIPGPPPGMHHHVPESRMFWHIFFDFLFKFDFDLQKLFLAFLNYFGLLGKYLEFFDSELFIRYFIYRMFYYTLIAIAQ